MSYKKWLLLAVLVMLPVAAAAQSYYDNLSKHHTAYGVSQLLSLSVGDDIDDGSTDNDSGGGPSSVKVENPTPVTMVASLLVYRRGTLREFDPGDIQSDGRSEVYLDCINIEVTPHGSVGITDSLWPGICTRSDMLCEDHNDCDPAYCQLDESVPCADNSDCAALNLGDCTIDACNQKPRRNYVEIISVPKHPVSIGGGWGRRMADGLGLNANYHEGSHVKHIGGLTVFNRVHPALFSLPSDSVVPGQQDRARECLCEIADELNAADLWLDFGVYCGSDPWWW